MHPYGHIPFTVSPKLFIIIIIIIIIYLLSLVMLWKICFYIYPVILWIVLLELQKMRRISVIYFLYLFIFSGLEFTLTFLTHNRFDFSRYVARVILFVLSWFSLELCHMVVFLFQKVRIL